MPKLKWPDPISYPLSATSILQPQIHLAACLSLGEQVEWHVAMGHVHMARWRREPPERQQEWVDLDGDGIKEVRRTRMRGFGGVWSGSD